MILNKRGDTGEKQHHREKEDKCGRLVLGQPGDTQGNQRGTLLTSPPSEESKGVSRRRPKITVRDGSEKRGDAPHHQLQCVKAPETDGRMMPFGEGLDPNQDIWKAQF